MKTSALCCETSFFLVCFTDLRMSLRMLSETLRVVGVKEQDFDTHDSGVHVQHPACGCASQGCTHGCRPSLVAVAK